MVEEHPAARAWTDAPETGRRLVELAFCSLILAWQSIGALKRHAFATDFHYAFWPAARHVLQGVSPYPEVLDFSRVPFIYPAASAVLLTPFALIPRLAADVVFTLVLCGSVVLALRLCGVRDWRCYGVAFLWAPVYSGIQAGNLSLLLALALAAVWRFREHRVAAPAIAAVMVATKVFFWPVVVWLAVRRGLRTATLSISIAAVITLASWSIIDFAGFGAYPDLMRTVTRVEAPISYSFVALELKVGLGLLLATFISTAVGVALLIVAARVQGDEDGRRSFVLTICALLLCSPVVWLHYYAFFVVAIALLRPKFGPLWLAPLLLWPCPMMSTSTWWPVVPLVVFGSAVAWAMRRNVRTPVPAPVPAAISATR
jgi:hypothetical protein